RAARACARTGRAKGSRWARRHRWSRSSCPPPIPSTRARAFRTCPFSCSSTARQIRSTWGATHFSRPTPPRRSARRGCSPSSSWRERGSESRQTRWRISARSWRRTRPRRRRHRRRPSAAPPRAAGCMIPDAPPRLPLPASRISAAPSYPVPDVPGVRSNFTREGYLDAVARVIEYVYAGDIFQANLSQRLQAPLVGTPLDLYRRLRNRNPAPFSAYLDFGDLVVASSSPERFLRVHPGGGVETRPIKGTRPRGLSPEHDAALARALVESDKDRAENVMIVDLLRNDLSRVSAAS